MKSNRILQTALIVIVVLIWAGVFFRTFSVIKRNKEKIKKDEALAIESQEAVREKLKKLKIDFQANPIPDPFRPFKTVKAYKPVKPVRTTPPIAAPAYLLQGIVWDPARPKAILVKSKIYHEPGRMKIGETVIVEKNNPIDYGKILDISDKYVIISTYNKKYRLKSNLWEEVE